MHKSLLEAEALLFLSVSRILEEQGIMIVVKCSLISSIKNFDGNLFYELYKFANIIQICSGFQSDKLLNNKCPGIFIPTNFCTL